MLNPFHRLASDRRGASAAEYALLLGLIGSAIALASTRLGAAIGCSIDQATATLEETKLLRNKNRGNSDPNGNAFGHSKKDCFATPRATPPHPRN